MHDLLEGVLQYEVKELLLQLIKVKCLFTLEKFNRRVSISVTIMIPISLAQLEKLS